MSKYADPLNILEKSDLTRVIRFMKDCLTASREDEFHKLILAFTSYLGFEYILYCYSKDAYTPRSYVHFVNLSYPDAWMEEYHARGFLEHEPVRIEMERMMAKGEGTFIYWDKFDREISEGEKTVINRRNEYGFYYGCSVFNNNESKDMTFLMTLGSGSTKPDIRTEVIMNTVIPVLTIVRKRLSVIELTGALSDREHAVADLLCSGFAAGDIASALDITEATVKFHIANIYKKLGVTNRQGAVSLIQAARYLGL
ncbi:MAG: LuxR C-terminal-related transcriptional regulator [Deferribacterales bacterium]